MICMTSNYGIKLDDLKQKLFDGTYKLCDIFYQMYIRDNCKEYIDIEI